MSTLSWKQLKLARKAQGLCPNCGGPPDDGHLYCRACRVSRAERTRRYRIKKRQPRPSEAVAERPPRLLPPVFTELARRLHIGQLAIREGRASATVHELVQGAIESVHTEARVHISDDAKRERERRRRRQLVARGLCPRCHKATEPGYVNCAACRAREAERSREARERRRVG